MRVAILISTLLLILPGCFVYDTFQTAATLDPGVVRSGAALTPTVLDVPVRVGVARHFDIAGRYTGGSGFQVDAKYQMNSAPLDVSMNLSLAHSFVNLGSTENRRMERTYAFSPLLIVGRTNVQEGWYAGLRAQYISRAGELDLIKEHTLFNDEGWVAGGWVLGGFVHTERFYLFLELNTYFAPHHKPRILPAFGFQYDLWRGL